jgi:hypothetical protein
MFLTERLFAVAQALDASMLQLVEDPYLLLRWSSRNFDQVMKLIGL